MISMVEGGVKLFELFFYVGCHILNLPSVILDSNRMSLDKKLLIPKLSDTYIYKYKTDYEERCQRLH